MSIRVRTILALNIYVIGLALVMGWIAKETAGHLVEERYVREMVGSAAGFLKGQRFPRSDSMMRHLHALYNAEWAAAENTADNIVASSLSPELTATFAAHVSGDATGGTVTLGDERYRFDSADVMTTNVQTGEPEPGRLYMLVPDAQFRQARTRAQARVAQVILPAALTATVVAVLLSVSITRPIRLLAAEMDHLSDGDVMAARPERTRRPPGPREVRQLAESFDRMLDHLGQARRQMLRSEQLATLGKVALGVAHELRNPLSGIKMNIRVLKDRDMLADDPGLAAILREIDRMTLYLDELMGLASGRQDAAGHLTREPAQLSDLARGVLTILAGRVRHATLEVRVDAPSDEPVVGVDENQIRQTMMNLLVNAIEASPPHSTIVVSIERHGNRLRCRVVDTGPGVAQDEEVFDAFVTGKPNGVGLGLYICRQIISRHGGEIGFENTETGAAFWFDLPVDDDSEEA
jgi:signal transduction histidine kinase